jgi:hypothetical protein
LDHEALQWTGASNACSSTFFSRLRLLTETSQITTSNANLQIKAKHIKGKSSSTAASSSLAFLASGSGLVE